MRFIKIVGRISEESLSDFPNFTAAITGKENIYTVFVMRQDHDFPIGTRFSITSEHIENTVELVAVTQQFDALVDEISHGWNTICAFKHLGNSIPILAGIPSTNSWYGNETELVLEAII